MTVSLSKGEIWTHTHTYTHVHTHTYTHIHTHTHTHTYTRRTPWEDEGRDWGDTKTKECQTLPATTRTRERPGADSPSQTQNQP